MDGHRAEAGPDEIIDLLGKDSELRERWHSYCLIGDALRSEPKLGGDIATRVMDALTDEPTALSPPRARARAVGRAKSGFLDRALPLAASLMGVAAVGWVAMTVYADRDEQAPAVAAVASLKEAPSTIERVASAPVVSETHQEYVFIHQASSRNGPIPGVAQYVRSVSELQTGGTR